MVRTFFPALISTWFLSAALGASAQAPLPQPTLPPALVTARGALEDHDALKAKALYEAYAKDHPKDARGPKGVGDAELMLHEYEAAEMSFRQAVMIDPSLWTAHKALVLVEAKLGRWEDFENERQILKSARERGADNLSPRESDLIDSFEIAGQQWLVREYFVPVGRSETRYNFEHFTAQGKVEEYISLEVADAAKAALSRDPQVKIGKDSQGMNAHGYALNWYTGSGHGTVRRYASEPPYRALRAEVMRWLKRSATEKKEAR